MLSSFTPLWKSKSQRRSWTKYDDIMLKTSPSLVRIQVAIISFSFTLAKHIPIRFSISSENFENMFIAKWIQIRKTQHHEIWVVQLLSAIVQWKWGQHSIALVLLAMLANQIKFRSSWPKKKASNGRSLNIRVVPSTEPLTSLANVTFMYLRGFFLSGDVSFTLPCPGRCQRTCQNASIWRASSEVQRTPPNAESAIIDILHLSTPIYIHLHLIPWVVELRHLDSDWLVTSHDHILNR